MWRNGAPWRFVLDVTAARARTWSWSWLGRIMSRKSFLTWSADFADDGNHVCQFHMCVLEVSRTCDAATAAHQNIIFTASPAPILGAEFCTFTSVSGNTVCCIKVRQHIPLTLVTNGAESQLVWQWQGLIWKSVSFVTAINTIEQNQTVQSMEGHK